MISSSFLNRFSQTVKEFMMKGYAKISAKDYSLTIELNPKVDSLYYRRAFIL